MVKHTQTIRRQIADELFECVWTFCGIGAWRVNNMITASIMKELIHGQINFIKFVEPNKFDNVYIKIWNIFVSSIF